MAYHQLLFAPIPFNIRGSLADSVLCIAASLETGLAHIGNNLFVLWEILSVCRRADGQNAGQQ